MTTVMFLGMSFCLPWAYWEEYKHKKQAKEALLAGNGETREPLLYGESLVSLNRRQSSTVCMHVEGACCNKKLHLDVVKVISRLMLSNVTLIHYRL